jgi:hypothetical protein
MRYQLPPFGTECLDSYGLHGWIARDPIPALNRLQPAKTGSFVFFRVFLSRRDYRLYRVRMAPIAQVNSCGSRLRRLALSDRPLEESRVKGILSHADNVDTALPGWQQLGMCGVEKDIARVGRQRARNDQNGRRLPSQPIVPKCSRVREVLPPIGGQRVERNEFSTHVIGQLDFKQLKRRSQKRGVPARDVRDRLEHGCRGVARAIHDGAPLVMLAPARTATPFAAQISEVADAVNPHQPK